jgi:hypothetical protein
MNGVEHIKVQWCGWYSVSLWAGWYRDWIHGGGQEFPCPSRVAPMPVQHPVQWGHTQGYGSWGVMLTTHPLLILRLQQVGAIAVSFMCLHRLVGWPLSVHWSRWRCVGDCFLWAVKLWKLNWLPVPLYRLSSNILHMIYIQVCFLSFRTRRWTSPLLILP